MSPQKRQQKPRPDLLQKTAQPQGLVAVVADLERRIEQLERQWRKPS